MTPEIILVTVILAASVILLVTERLPVDVTGLGIIAVLMVSGLLTPKEAVAGFANPAPLAVGALFVVSKGLVRTGSLNMITRLAVHYTKGNASRLMLLSLILVGTLSAFLNNAPVVVLFISIIMTVCVRYGFAPSKFLIPLSYISILAGTCTLIGTSTNILVSDVAAGMGNAPIGMFELSKLGVPIALVGGLIIYLFSHRLMPEHDSPHGAGDGEVNQYLSELQIPEGSPFVGRSPESGFAPEYEAMELHEIYRGQKIFHNKAPISLEPGDLVLVKASANDLTRIVEKGHALQPVCSATQEIELPKGSAMAELLIPAGSNVQGAKAGEAVTSVLGAAQLVGIKRRRHHYAWDSACNMTLRIGDIILVRTNEQTLDRIRKTEDFITLNDKVAFDLINWRRAPAALGIFGLMVALVATGTLNILEGAFAAAFAMVVTGCLTIREAYQSIDVKVLMLIIGTISLGAALQKTGADTLYADSFLSLFRGQGPEVILSAFIFLTSLLSHFLSNNSTAVLLVPVGVATAAALGVDPRPFIIGIAFGASACYATPIGYKTNLIVYGPGGYRFTDFLRLGIPLALFVWISASLFIPYFWPFHP